MTVNKNKTKQNDTHRVLIRNQRRQRMKNSITIGQPRQRNNQTKTSDDEVLWNESILIGFLVKIVIIVSFGAAAALFFLSSLCFCPDCWLSVIYFIIFSLWLIWVCVSVWLFVHSLPFFNRSQIAQFYHSLDSFLLDLSSIIIGVFFYLCSISEILPKKTQNPIIFYYCRS